jgi:hypothetical protein
MRVMVHTSPKLRRRIQQRQGANLQPTSSDNTEQRCSSTAIIEESSLIDAYFRSIHGITPMVDEIGFRRCLAQGGGVGRARRPWLALLNMVLTLGYIAANEDSQPGHTFFFDRASRHLDVNCFASGHIYTVQALALFGGYYLHFLNRPNMASAVMGAAHRMAVAMGLHRVPSSSPAISSLGGDVDTHTRTWWSLFCLDIWAGTTLGRPLAGTWNAQSIAKLPTPLHFDLVSFELFETMTLC